MTTETLAARVDAGAKLLDEKRPGWFREIAMDRLAMDSCGHCILGQIYGNFSSGKYFLEINLGSLYGFDRAFGQKISYTDLADLWRAEIRTRLERA